MKLVVGFSLELNVLLLLVYRMVILASREHTCIHPAVSRGAAKNEKCKELLEVGVKLLILTLMLLVPNLANTK